jgi:hypothetical protein
MKCQQAGCVKDAEVYVTNHGLGQVHALCREHAQWRMMEWQNAGYTAFWQTHIGDVEASAAKRTPTAMTQPDVTAEADGLPTMSIQEALSGPDPEAAPEPEAEPAPEAPAHPEQPVGFASDEERDLVIQALFQTVHAQGEGLKKLHAAVAILHQGLEEMAQSGLTEFHTGPKPEPVHPGAPDPLPEEEVLDAHPDLQVVGESVDDMPLADDDEPDEIPGEQDAWDAAGAVEAQTPVAPESEEDSPVDHEAEAGSPGLVLQFSPRHRYHKFIGSVQPAEGDTSLTHTSGCGQTSDAWEPKDAFAPGTHPCRKCWPKR